MKHSYSKRALFVLHEGIGSTIFSSQVMEHAKGMKQYSIDFDILSFDTLSKTWALSNYNLTKFKKSDPGINIILKKGLNIYYPFSLFYNLILLIKFLYRNRKTYSFIQARADYTAFLCILAKPFHGLPVYWDCRGDAVDELKDSLSRKNGIIKTIGNLYLVSFDRLARYINCKKSDGAIFVSDSLYSLFKSKLKTDNYQIIPCPVSEDKFFFDAELRLDMRTNLKIQSDQIVFLYSGSMIAYQSLHEQYDQYVEILKSPKNKIIIATSEPEAAKNFFGDLLSDRLIIVSVSFKEMNAYYNLADFAFLMREKKQLNYVASPTKFGEYCLTGLPVIMNDNVSQAYLFSKELGNYVSHSTIDFISFSNEIRADISKKSKSLYSRVKLQEKYIKLYKSALEA